METRRVTASPEFDPLPCGPGSALNVMVRGEEVIILVPGRQRLTMTAHDAEISAQRLLDAAEIARGRLPKGRP